MISNKLRLILLELEEATLVREIKLKIVLEELKDLIGNLLLEHVGKVQ